MRVAVLGAGPSGMVAAHASAQCGAYIDIFDANPDRSRRNSGVYFLHASCDLLLDKIIIKQTILGAKLLDDEELGRVYSRKVYGDSDVAGVSILDAKTRNEFVGFNAGQAVDRLWDLYGRRVQCKTINNLEDVLSLLDKYDKVISTIPAYVLYPDLSYPMVKTHVKVGTSPDNEAFIFYNVNDHTPWYRCSALFGVFVQEYEYGYLPERAGKYQYRMVRKVIGNGIESGVQDLLLAGRYGEWKKSVLTHHVYWKVLGWLGG